MSNQKPPARIILTAWGESYINQILDFTFPAMLAPGNLPVLAENFECELVFVTQSDQFSRIQDANSFKAMERYCTSKFVANDDVIADNVYGAVLTHSLWRGFEDLGESVLDYYLVFLNSDFILADGSYRTMVKHMLAGERLIHAPSYCTSEESVLPTLRHMIDPETHVLAVQPRDMARMILENLHCAPRAKIVNQKTWCIDRLDQFYWYVDPNTLLGRQMPSAIVCMRPTRYRDGPACFWDFSTVSELCPGVEPCVLGDSDDFLMLELRMDTTYMEQTHLGWHTPAEIAVDLNTYMTKDQLDYASQRLILHSEDIPKTASEAGVRLDDYVKEVFEHIAPEPVPYIDHKYWLIQNAEIGKAVSASLGEESPSEGLEGHLKTALKQFIRPFYYAVMGQAPYFKKTHPCWGSFHLAIQVIERALEDIKPDSVLIFHTGKNSVMAPILDHNCTAYATCNFTDLYRRSSTYDKVAQDHGYDFCICELAYSDLTHFRTTYENLIRPLMKAGAQVIVHYPNIPNFNIPERNFLLIADAFPQQDTSMSYYAGAPSPMLLALLDDKSVKTLQEGYKKPWLLLPGVIALMGTALMSFFVNRAISRHPPHVYPRACTSITTVIDVQPDYEPPRKH